MYGEAFDYIRNQFDPGLKEKFLKWRAVANPL